jgi:hypothetical protein
MPRRKTATKTTTHQAMKNASYENRLTAWLMQDGWQLFSPVLDHGHQTDILISDGPNYHRIQVKTVAASSSKQKVENQWQDSNVNVVVFFARNSNWGYVAPAFIEKRKALNSDGHYRFQTNKSSFLKAFHQLD